MGKPDVCLLQLPLLRLPLKLLIDLVDHSQPAGANGVAEALETAVGIHRQLPLQAECASSDVLGGFPSGAELKVLHYNELGDGETIVNDSEVDLLTRVLDSRIVIGHLGRSYILLEVDEVIPVLELPLHATDGKA